MKYGSVCSGIEAATVAWHELGWQPVFFAEVDRSPSAVLAHHYPNVPNHGDFTTIQKGDYEPIDVLVGGTPCQDFSVAGLRAGLDGERGNLTLEFLRLADRLRPEWVVWENVPGVLSSASHRSPDPCPPPDPLDVELDGAEMEVDDEYDSEELHALNSFLAGLSELGYGWAYRVLDAQHSGVPQRRRRVFVVGHLGDWRRAAAVLFERHSMSGDTPPRREAGEGFTHDVAPSLTGSGRGSERAGDSRGQDCCLPVYEGLRLRESRARGPERRGALLSGVSDSQFVAESESRVPSAVGRALVSSTGSIAHCLNGGGMGRQDFETETLLAVGGFFDDVTPPLTTKPYGDNESREGMLVTHVLRGEGFDASEDGTGRATPLVPIAIQAGTVRETASCGPDGVGVRQDGIAYTLEARSEVQAVCFSSKDHGADAGDIAPTLRSMGHDGSHANGGGQLAVAISANQRGELRARPVHGSLSATKSAKQFDGIMQHMAVRRLTPLECERLMAFPDGYTAVPQRGGIMADGPRYKMLGNSMVTLCMKWIGQRIEAVNAVARQER
jgi:DNA (cytosine-5)-methyltransferase 1